MHLPLRAQSAARILQQGIALLTADHNTCPIAAGAVHGHILSIIQIAKDMVFGNRLLPCFEDILQLKDLLQGRGGITSMKQDSGVLEVEFRTNPWVMRIR